MAHVSGHEILYNRETYKSFAVSELLSLKFIEMKADLLAKFLRYQASNVERSPEDEANAMAICQEFYATLDAPLDSVYNEFLAAGGQSTIYRCGTTNSTIEPAVTASKIFYTVDDKNMTELEIINRATADAGVRAPLYYFHENGFIEEFLSGKLDLWKTQEKGLLTVRDREIWSNVAKNVGEMHAIELDNIDQEKYLHGIEGWWNTHEIAEHFTTLQFVMKNDYFGNGHTYDVSLAYPGALPDFL